MNIYLVALLGLLAVFIVGFLMYGVLLKGSVAGNDVKLTLGRFIVAGIGMYVIALAFSVLYNNMSFANGAEGVTKGLYLGLLVGVPFFAVPFFADAPYLKGKDSVMWAVLVNWVVAFAVLGVVVGALLK